jgi:hypothetical protein
MVGDTWIKLGSSRDFEAVFFAVTVEFVEEKKEETGARFSPQRRLRPSSEEECNDLPTSVGQTEDGGMEYAQT